MRYDRTFYCHCTKKHTTKFRIIVEFLANNTTKKAANPSLKGKMCKTWSTVEGYSKQIEGAAYHQSNSKLLLTMPSMAAATS